MTRSTTVLSLAAATLSLALAFAPAAFADDMSKDSMSKTDTMKKDTMKKRRDGSGKSLAASLIRSFGSTPGIGFR